MDAILDLAHLDSTNLAFRTLDATWDGRAPAREALLLLKMLRNACPRWSNQTLRSLVGNWMGTYEVCCTFGLEKETRGQRD